MTTQGRTASVEPVRIEAAERPANRITVDEAKALVDSLNPGLPDEDGDDYDLEWQDGWEDEA